jgi:hypothetical protein
VRSTTFKEGVEQRLEALTSSSSIRHSPYTGDAAGEPFVAPLLPPKAHLFGGMDDGFGVDRFGMFRP